MKRVGRIEWVSKPFTNRDNTHVWTLKIYVYNFTNHNLITNIDNLEREREGEREKVCDKDMGDMEEGLVDLPRTPINKSLAMIVWESFNSLSFACFLRHHINIFSSFFSFYDF